MARFNRNNSSKVIFISYIPDDIFYASELAEYLQKAGHTIITTPYHETKTKCEALCKALVASCDVLISITSPTANRSERFWSDIANARLNDTPIIPLVVHHFTEAIPMRHFIDAVDDLTLGCERVEMAVKRANGYVSNHLGKRESIGKRVMKAVATAAAVAVMTIIGILFS
jgi:hypothetical protein